MNVFSSFDDLKSFHFNNSNQKYYYVLLINPNDITPAGERILNNLDLFDLDTGNHCDYFLPGFLNTEKGLSYNPGIEFGDFKISAYIDRLGPLSFDYKKFYHFFKEIEIRNKIGWEYSGGCELLLLEIANSGKIKTDNLITYNLDDIIRNQRSISEFIRGMLLITINENKKENVKNQIDTLFYSLIIPDSENELNSDFSKKSRSLFEASFNENEYVFISYSTKDFFAVKTIRDKLIRNNSKCWMAPFDIPAGTNYAYIIELAIKNARKFVLMLSKHSVQSIWVCNELLRAVSRFGHENPDKICVIWLDEPFSIDETPFALPLASVQMQLYVNGENDYERIISFIDGKENVEKNEKSDCVLKSTALKLKTAILSMDGSMEKLQAYINTLNDMSKIPSIYQKEIYTILTRLCVIISSCQSMHRLFSQEESETLTTDANLLLSYCRDLIN